ncbi:MAG: hypothetical protein QM817_06505 [Archangium sp.]
MRLFLFTLGVLAVASSCSPKVEPPPPPPPAETMRTTYRVLGGVSMGAIGGMALASTHPEKFDGVAALGGPLDAAFFQRFTDQFVTAGFCSKAELEAIMQRDPVLLNDPTEIEACASPHRGVPMQWEHPNDFNHLHVTNNGGTFERESFLRMVEDLMLAYGNIITQSSTSPIAPPGVDPERLRHPPADACTNPTRVRNLKNLEYNPEGTYDAITFCDGTQTVYFCQGTMQKVDFCSDRANIANPLPIAQEAAFATAYCATRGGALIAKKDEYALFWLAHAGEVDPCRQRDLASSLMLAFDYNGNGRRDYGEPIVVNGQERYDDVGVDGCADAFENGNGGCNTSAASSPSDLNHDNYDADTNAAGTEQNWKHDDGEPFRDNGLDGVPNSGDSGEGNGTFDMNEGRKRMFALDGRTNFNALDDAGKKRFNVLLDGGIHDIFNLGLNAKHLFSAVKRARQLLGVSVGEYRDFVEIPGMKDRQSGNFNPWNRSWKTVPKDLLTLYGKDQRTDTEIELGEGDHVGLPGQAASRFQIVFNWVAYMWPNAPKPTATFGQSTPADYRTETFFSNKLGAKWEYSISVPPGYGDPANADKQYPVAYLLHGYGMEPSDFVAAAILANNFVTDTNLQLRPVIYVFPNGRCCFTNATTGERDCRNKNDQGVDIDRVPGARVPLRHVLGEPEGLHWERRDALRRRALRVDGAHRSELPHVADRRRGGPLSEEGR